MNEQELPILMKGELVLATDRGDKTETRRVTGLGRANECPDKAKVVMAADPQDPDGAWWIHTAAGSFHVKCPYGSPGTHLWVREKFRSHGFGTWGIQYAADKFTRNDERASRYKEMYEQRWRPSIFMPRWASRYTLEVLDIDCERLQDITEDGAEAEGVSPSPLGEFDADDFPARYRGEFVSLWDSINAKPKPIMVNKKIDHYVSYPWENIFDVREHRGKKWFVRGNPHVFVVKYKKLDSDTLEG